MIRATLPRYCLCVPWPEWVFPRTLLFLCLLCLLCGALLSYMEDSTVTELLFVWRSKLWTGPGAPTG